MTLAAVYIKQHKYLFNNEPQVLNFGGRYFYDLKFITDNEITIYRKENKNYIDDFYLHIHYLTEKGKEDFLKLDEVF